MSEVKAVWSGFVARKRAVGTRTLFKHASVGLACQIAEETGLIEQVGWVFDAALAHV